MKDFVASNGIPVALTNETPSGAMLTTSEKDGTYPYTNARGDDVQALREFFQAEADERLGRFRHGQFLVYPDDEPGYVMVIDETTPDDPWRFARDSVSFAGEPGEAARSYFDAHPEPKPLPDVDGIYAVSPQVRPYERLIQRRNGKWLHLRRHASEFEEDTLSAEFIAQAAANEGRLTRLVPEVS